MDLLFNAEFINFSEKEILENAGSDNHLGQGVKRLIFKTVRCTKSFCDENNGEIYRKGQEYKLWIAEYNDKLLGVTCWFTAMPRILDADAIKGPVKTFLYGAERGVSVCRKFGGENAVYHDSKRL